VKKYAILSEMQQLKKNSTFHFASVNGYTIYTYSRVRSKILGRSVRSIKSIPYVISNHQPKPDICRTLLTALFTAVHPHVMVRWVLGWHVVNLVVICHSSRHRHNSKMWKYICWSCIIWHNFVHRRDNEIQFCNLGFLVFSVILCFQLKFHEDKNRGNIT